MMDILIKVSDEKYKAIKKCFENGCALSVTDMAILNGTPLPKEHGRMCDTDAMRNDILLSRAMTNAEKIKALCIVNHFLERRCLIESNIGG